MNKTHLLLLICLAFFLVAAMLVPTTPAIEWRHIGGGGSSVSQGDRVLDGVVGQGVIGLSNQADKDLCSGYLCTPATRSVFLPVVMRNN